MTNITNNPNRRTSNGFGGLPLVPTNTGSRLTRSVGYFENALYKTFTEVVRAPASFVYGATAVGDVLKDAVKAGWKYANTDPNKSQGSSVTNQSPNSKYKKFGLQTNGAGGPGGGQKPISNTPAPIPIQSDPDETYSWNLPPHKWSIPVDPSEIYSDVSAPKTDSHSSRRGKIFLARKYVAPTATTDAKTGNKTFDRQGKTNYGFQFLWNPETFSQSTSVNWGITPNQNDATAILTGLTGANSTINFTLRLDRTNDFAAAKEALTTTSLGDRKLSLYVDTLAKYYTEGQAPRSGADFANNMDIKISDLLARGTNADLEFLYKTINGDGYKTSWGTTTSNINFLIPTIIRLDLGPQRLVGMIQSLDVNHIAFTRNMIPIRTDVTLSVDLRASVGFTTSNFGLSSDEAAAVINR